MTAGPSYRWPRRGSKRLAMLRMLLGGGAVTHLKVLDKARTYRAAAVVHALKNLGFPIVTDLRPIEGADGRPVRVAFYFIPTPLLGDVLADAMREGVQW